MKVKFLGKGSPMTLTHGKIYEVMALEGENGRFYRIVDDTDEDYLYHKDDFEIVEPNPLPPRAGRYAGG